MNNRPRLSLADLVAQSYYVRFCAKLPFSVQCNHYQDVEHNNKRTPRKPSRRSVIQNMFNIMLDYVAYFNEVSLLACSPARLLACSPARLLACSLTRLLAYSLTRLLAYSLTRLLAYSLTRLLAYSLTRLLAYSLRPGSNAVLHMSRT